MSRYMNSCFIHELDKNSLISFAITATKSYSMTDRKQAILDFCIDNFKDFLELDSDECLYHAEYDEIEIDNRQEVQNVVDAINENKYSGVAVLEMMCCDSIEFNEDHETREAMIKALYATDITSYDVDTFYELFDPYSVASEAYKILVDLKNK